MKIVRVSLLIVITISSFFVAPTMVAQRQPICDVTCSPGPDPTSGIGYRVLPINDRGAGGGNPRRRPPKPPKPSELVLGSPSYNYDVPLLFLPGRNGLNVNLA